MNMKPSDLRGIIVDSVRIKAGGSGVEKTFEEPKRAIDLLPEDVTEFLHKWFDQEVIESTNATVTYNLTVRSITRRGAISRARAFTRLKHPSRIDVVDVAVKGRDKRMESFSEKVKYYKVQTSVRA